MPDPSLPLSSRVPTATYRLQLNSHFKFCDVKKIIPYLAEIGISDVYSSPAFQASPESTHGYDVSDHNILNPSLGNQEDYNSLIVELHKFKMGQILDFVPNHMGVSGSANLWWHDVLENGLSSRYAFAFDIDWHPPQPYLDKKIFIPILGEMYGNILGKGELQVEYSAGEFRVKYHEHTFPLDPMTYPQILERAIAQLTDKKEKAATLKTLGTRFSKLPQLEKFDRDLQEKRANEIQQLKKQLDGMVTDSSVKEALQIALKQLNGKSGDFKSFDALHQLLEKQNFHLSFWRSSSDDLNYRRFFDVETLVAVRMERPEVFTESHRLISELLKSEAVTGLRIDHIDGLWNPSEYLQKLQSLYHELTGKNSLYLLVEKILCGNETLPPDWKVSGTTGYEFASIATGVLVDQKAEQKITEIYRHFTGVTESLEDIIYEKKKLAMHRSLANTVISLGSELHRISAKDLHWRDLTLRALTRGVEEVIACFPVYRTYRKPTAPLSTVDFATIHYAVQEAKRRNQDWYPLPGEFIEKVLTGNFPPQESPKEFFQQAEEWVLKFQQFTGAVMAKGVEDTTFYVFNRLNALNEVGSNPAKFGCSIDEFHLFNKGQLEKWPQTMLATSTHDTKISEDVRARLCALSELPEEWQIALERWRKCNENAKTNVEGKLAPDANEEYLLYQMLLGSWPLAKEDFTPEYITRLQGYMHKAINEAKVNSFWTNQNAPWLKATNEFIAKILDPSFSNHFLSEFKPLAEKVAALGMVNSLSQVILKLTSPGVPDIYQGNELWEFNLVDPDNRRPIDYEKRKKILESLSHRSKESLLQDWKDGAIKLSITRTLLKFRQQAPELFQRGSYKPCKVEGDFSDQLISFERSFEKQRLVVIVPRLTARMNQPPLGSAWKKTQIQIASSANEKWTDLLTGNKAISQNSSFLAADLFTIWPFAVLTTSG